MNKVKAVQSTLLNGDVKRFENSLILAGLIADAHKWVKDAEGQTFLKANALGMEDFIKQVYGFQKSYYYRLLRANDVPKAVVDEFRAETLKAKATDLNAPLSIEALLAFHKESELESKGESDGESEGESDGESKVGKAKAVFTLAFKVDGFTPVSIRIDAGGELKTTNKGAEIETALDYLRQALEGAGVVKKATNKPTGEKAKANTKANKKARKAQVLKGLDELSRATFEEVTLEDTI